MDINAYHRVHGAGHLHPRECSAVLYHHVPSYQLSLSNTSQLLHYE